MEHEIRLKTYEELTLKPLVPEIPRRQRCVVDCSLNISAADNSLRLLGALEPEESAYLVASEDLRDVAAVVGRHFRLPVILLPPEMLKEKAWPWAIVAAKGSIYHIPIM